jgi:hypothetical protein
MQSLQREKIMKKKYKPGNGWKMLNGAVYEKGSVRIHTLGYIRIKNVLSRAPDDKLYKYLRISGGNRKRAVMIMANQLCEELR